MQTLLLAFSRGVNSPLVAGNSPLRRFSPPTGDFLAAFGAVAVLVKAGNFVAAAFNHQLTAGGAKGIVAGKWSQVTGVNMFEAPCRNYLNKENNRCCI